MHGHLVGVSVATSMGLNTTKKYRGKAADISANAATATGSGHVHCFNIYWYMKSTNLNIEGSTLEALSCKVVHFWHGHPCRQLSYDQLLKIIAVKAHCAGIAATWQKFKEQRRLISPFGKQNMERVHWQPPTVSIQRSVLFITVKLFAIGGLSLSGNTTRWVFWWNL